MIAIQGRVVLLLHLTINMSESTPPTSVHSLEIAADLLAAAAQRRAQQDANGLTGAQSIQEYEMRQAFRRLIDPGILRPNSKDVATASLKVFWACICSSCIATHKTTLF